MSDLALTFETYCPPKKMSKDVTKLSCLTASETRFRSARAAPATVRTAVPLSRLTSRAKPNIVALRMNDNRDNHLQHFFLNTNKKPRSPCAVKY